MFSEIKGSEDFEDDDEAENTD